MQELAKKAGISLSTLYMIESGRSRPSFRTVRKLGEALGLPPAQVARLLDNEDDTAMRFEDAQAVDAALNVQSGLSIRWDATRETREQAKRRIMEEFEGFLETVFDAMEKGVIGETVD